MSKDNFLVKKSLAFLPQLSAPLNPVKGDFYKDSNLDVLQYNGSSWVKIGSGSGAGDLDTFHTEVFDDSSLADFTITGVGVSLDSVNQLNGTKSLKLIHQAAINQTVKKTISVPLKYRGQAVTFAVLSKSNATTGNVTVLFRDETNAIDLQSSQQIQADSTSKTFQYGVKIPSNCLSFSYTITALPEAGLKETFIDDISIRAYWMGTASQGQTSYSYNSIIQQAAYLTNVSTFTNATITGPLESSVGSDIFTYNSATGIYTFLKDANINASFSGVYGSGTAAYLYIRKNGSIVSTATQATGGRATCVAYNYKFLVGETLSFTTGDGVNGISTSINAEAIVQKTFTSTDLVPAKAMNGSASITIPVAVINSYSAVLDGITGAKISESLSGWITSSIDSGTGDCTINYAGLGLTVIPSIEATVEWSGGVKFAGLVSVGLTSARITSSSVAGSLTDPVKYNITLNKQGVDYKNPLTSTETKTWSSTQSLITEVADSFLDVSAASQNGSGFWHTFSFSDFKGSEIQVVNDATNGARVVALSSGIYDFSFSPSMSTASNSSGQSIVYKYSAAGVLLIEAGYGSTYNAAGFNGNVAIAAGSVYLNAGEFLRFFSSSTLNGLQVLTVSKQGQLKQLNTVSDQKIEMPTHELRFEGSSSRGSVATGIVKFDTVAKVRGDAFEIVNTVADGTYVRIKKAGRLDVSVSLTAASASTFYITKNQTSLTSPITIVTSEFMTSQAIDGANNSASSAASIDVVVNDIIRIAHNANPIGSPNSLNLTLQEQKVAVSVSNVLPQFSESDILVKAAGNAGQTVTASVTNIPFQTIYDSTGGGSWNGSQFTVPEDGVYSLSGSTHATASVGRRFYLAVDGVLFRQINASIAVDTVHPFNITDSFSKGQVLSIRPSDTHTLNNNTLFHFISISKIGKPNVTGVDVTPFINIPQPTNQSIRCTTTGVKVGSFVRYSSVAESINSNIFSYTDDGTNATRITALKTCNLFISGSIGNAAGPRGFIIIKNGSIVLGAGNSEVTTTTDQASATVAIIANPGDFFQVSTAETLTQGILSVLATALADQILTEPETFSTDTANLQYASSAQYTLATLPNAPVGTFITGTYAANTNTFTQTTTAPTQTTDSMKQNGILIYSRPYQSLSTAAQPTVFFIQIGKGLKGKSIEIFKSLGKSINGSADWVMDGPNNHGMSFKDYNEATGVLVIDAGFSLSNSNNYRDFKFSDTLAQTSAYVVINASKNPALVGIRTDDVAARSIATSSQVIPSGTQTILNWDAVKTFDTHGAMGTTTFTSPVSGFYAIDAGILYDSNAWTNGQILDLNIAKNGTIVKSNRNPVSAATTNYGVSVSDTLYLAKGETVYITAFHNRGAGTSLLSNASWNTFSIKKV